ncbi:BlaI/MecI/CopY family transcriptional regulator [Tissierella praeacuta]|uniref:BlaI/MecI/CopY family transcriptional regulator n=1 Tax=Tissierella praeacuta TaxID=43131 RepID=UPI0028AC6300|nr:BlaI/MecI/CopY family transcriptional regulator [Tissierella praeacuta]
MIVQQLTIKEIEVMEILWKEQRALTSSEIVELSRNSTWKKSSIHILLNSLLKKGAIEVEGFIRNNKAYARTFKPIISFEDYTVIQIQRNKSFSNKSIPKIVAALIKNQVSFEEQNELKRELQKIIDEKSNDKKKE